MHTPVLLQEVTQALSPAPGKRYVDATLGYAGHTIALLAAGAEVVGIDQDADILELATKRIQEAGYSKHFTPMHASFADALSSARLPDASYQGILFDLGVSSFQLDTPSRGFSFRFDAPLDMRMDQSLTVTAKDLVNGLGKKELTELFLTLGEEKQAGKIARAICERRHKLPIETTGQLASLIERTIGKSSRIHPATKVFQALRMAVNSERDQLKAALSSALSKLAVGGILALISFHSLEDQIIEDFFAKTPALTPLYPNAISPSIAEIHANPRARSAKLRVGKKL